MRSNRQTGHFALMMIMRGSCVPQQFEGVEPD